MFFPVEATLRVEGRVGAFFPLNSKFQRIYGDVYPCYEIEVGQTLCDCYELWLNVDDYYRSTSVRGCGDTSLNILSFSAGPKRLFCFCNDFAFYTGLGISVAWARINDEIIGREYDTSVGLVVKSGLYYYLNSCWFLDLFCDYNYQPAFHHRRVDIGGIRTGLGLGYAF